MNSTLPRTVTTLMLSLLLCGCMGVSYEVGISGFRDASKSTDRTYWILPANADVRESDLEFREYARLLKRALQKSGHMPSERPETASLLLFISYGIGDMQESHQSYQVPVYGQTGGNTYSFSSTTYYGGSSATSFGTIYQQPKWGVVGSQAVSESTTTYLRRLRVDAIANVKPEGVSPPPSVWRTDIASRGTSADLRKVMPVMILAAEPFFGRDTGGQVVVDVEEDDPALQAFRASR